jgi:gluconolactonase
LQSRFDGLKPRVVASGLRFPEGPVVLPSGDVLVTEIGRGTLTLISDAGEKRILADLGGGPNGAAVGPDGRIYVTNHGGATWIEDEHGLRPKAQAPDYQGGRIERFDLATGKVEVLYRRAGDLPLKGPNDLVFDHHGGFWFTDYGKNRLRETDRTGVFYARADGGDIREVIFPMEKPNGIALSADGGTLYVVETFTARLWAFEIVGPGQLNKLPWPSPHGGRLVVGLGGYHGFDGIALDSEGNICCATFLNSFITVIAPSGEILGQVPSPDIYTTNLAFGGPDRRTLYVTLGSTGKLLAFDWPVAGLALNWADRPPSPTAPQVKA